MGRSSTGRSFQTNPLATSSAWQGDDEGDDLDDREDVEPSGSGYRRAVTVDETLVCVDVATLQAASSLEERSASTSVSSSSSSSNARTPKTPRTSDPDLDDSEAWLEATKQQQDRPTIPCPVDDHDLDAAFAMPSESENDDITTIAAAPTGMQSDVVPNHHSDSDLDDPEDQVPTALVDYRRGLALDTMTLRAALAEAAAANHDDDDEDYRATIDREEEREDNLKTEMTDYRETIDREVDIDSEALAHAALSATAQQPHKRTSSGFVRKAQLPPPTVEPRVEARQTVEIAPEALQVQAPREPIARPATAPFVAPLPTHAASQLSPLAPRVDLPPRPVTAALPQPSLTIATPPYDVEPMLRFLPPPVVRRAFISALQAQVPPPKRSAWVTLAIVFAFATIVGAAAVFAAAVLLAR